WPVGGPPRRAARVCATNEWRRVVRQNHPAGIVHLHYRAVRVPAAVRSRSFVPRESAAQTLADQRRSVTAGDISARHPSRSRCGVAIPIPALRNSLQRSRTRPNVASEAHLLTIA